jgi:hypothetical protein
MQEEPLCCRDQCECMETQCLSASSLVKLAPRRCFQLKSHTETGDQTHVETRAEANIDPCGQHTCRRTSETESVFQRNFIERLGENTTVFDAVGIRRESRGITKGFHLYLRLTYREKERRSLPTIMAIHQEHRAAR